MINVELLKNKIDESGYKLKFISKQLNITYQGFLNKINGSSEFKLSEISYLTDLLKLTIEEKELIFFNQNVD